MMMRTQRIRRISPATRRPNARRQVTEPKRRTSRAQPPLAAGRRAGALPAPRRHAPTPAPKTKPRRRARHLRLVVANVRPRWRRASAKPTLRLIRGRAPRLALPPRRAAVPVNVKREEPRSRAAQLVFVVAMAAIGLVALATSVGQILARGM